MGTLTFEAHQDNVCSGSDCGGVDESHIILHILYSRSCENVARVKAVSHFTDLWWSQHLQKQKQHHSELFLPERVIFILCCQKDSLASLFPT